MGPTDAPIDRRAYQCGGSALLIGMETVGKDTAPVPAVALSRDPYRTQRQMLGTRIVPVVLPWQSGTHAVRTGDASGQTVP